MPSNRHGLTALKSAVKCRGLSSIDTRTKAARSLIQWRSELLRDLGGEEKLSAQKLCLVDAVTRTRLFLDHVDAFLIAQPSIINKKRKSLIPLVGQRQQLADTLARQLQALGLNRVEHDGGAIPPEWIEKVKPHEVEPEVEK